MNNTDKLLTEMKDWLQLDKDDAITIAECFRMANNLDKWRVDMFYTTFAPYMANILDDYKATKKDDQFKMAYEALRNQVQLHVDSGCLDVVAIDLRKQIELCEGYINDNT